MRRNNKASRPAAASNFSLRSGRGQAPRAHSFVLRGSHPSIELSIKLGAATNGPRSSYDFRCPRAEILGGGARAFQKYEAGEVLVSKPMTQLLRLLDRDPRRLKELAD